MISKEQAASLDQEFFGSNPREQVVLDDLAQRLEGCDRFLDIGANVGQYACFANQVLRDCEILCVEANPALIPTLTSNLERAAEHAPRSNRFTILNRVVSDDPAATIPFFCDSRTTTSSIFQSRHEASPGEPVHVKGITLAELFEPARKTFIKLDIEGGEYRALLGAGAFLASDTDWLIEIHPWGDPERKAHGLHVLRLLAKHGFSSIKVGPDYFYGSHYRFVRASRGERVTNLIRYAPALYSRFLLDRFAPRLQHTLADRFRPRV